jgi:hypothetical protein
MSYRDQILTFFEEYNAPVPAFLVAKDLQIPIKNVNSCLDELLCQGEMKTFDVALLGKKERIYYRE